MLPWVTRGGQLKAHTRGVVFGMHIMGSPVQDTTDRMGMTPKGVRHSISISEGIVNGVRDDAIPDENEMDNLVLSFPGRAQRMVESGGENCQR